MDIKLDKGMMDRLIAEIRGLTKEEALQRLERHRGRSIGAKMETSLHFMLNPSEYIAPAKDPVQVDWNSLDFGVESKLEFGEVVVDAANDDSYAMAA